MSKVTAVDIVKDQSLTLLPAQDCPKGNYVSNVVKLPAGLDQYKVMVDRNDWPDTGDSSIEVITEISYDGGKSWGLLVGFTSRGGTDIVNGQKVTESSVTWPVPRKEIDRLLRTTIHVLSDLNTKLTVQASTR